MPSPGTSPDLSREPRRLERVAEVACDHLVETAAFELAQILGARLIRADGRFV